MFSHILKIVWKNKGQNIMLLIEIFLSFIILAGVIAYLISNFEKLQSPLGFETKDRYMVIFSDYHQEIDSLAYAATIDNLKMRLDNTPEVKTHCFGNIVYPFSWNNWSSNAEINNVNVSYNLASFDEDYFETMNLKLKEGRPFNKPLSDQEIPEIVVNELFVKQLGGQNLLDTVLNLNGDKRIVGVVENYKNNGEFTEEVSMVLGYQSPYDREHATCLYLHLQEDTSEGFEEKINRLITETTGKTDFLIYNLEEKRIQQSRPTWVNISAISILALFLIINVAMGLFGVLWYNINKRRYEISLRKAMGASESKILIQFVLELVGLAVIALLFGSFIIWQIAYFDLINFLDKPMIYKGILFANIFILLLVTLCALYPSWRAARMHPAVGLKEE